MQTSSYVSKVQHLPYARRHGAPPALGNIKQHFIYAVNSTMPPTRLKISQGGFVLHVLVLPKQHYIVYTSQARGVLIRMQHAT